MFDELVGQVKRLFSSKNNGGKLVYKLTDRLHYYKLVLLALSIVILLGYSQFRDHFKCHGAGKLDTRTLTNFCWINGTTTLNIKNPGNNEQDLVRQNGQSSGLSRLVPHVGIFFELRDGRYELTDHNYMRSLWALLILMAICSFIAQRCWAAIFNDKVLGAILQLPGHEKLPFVVRAQEARAYDKLMCLKIPSTNKQVNDQNNQTIKENFRIIGNEYHQSIDIIGGDENEHSRLLDYYPNQLIYLLIAKRTSAYRLSCLRLRRAILTHSLCSFCLTLLQFLLPLMFIGNEYTLYGYKYFLAWWKYASNQLTSPQVNRGVNTIDYELSSRIFPTLTQCEYKQFGYAEPESITVQCTVPINEICGKLFVVIWWFVVLNLAVEVISLTWTLAHSTHLNSARYLFGRQFWPNTKREARVIATFRHNSTELQMSRLKQHEQPDRGVEQMKDGFKMSERERKHLEAEGHAEIDPIGSKKWYLWCSRDIGVMLINWLRCKASAKRRGGARDSQEFGEIKEDPNIYYLLYLLYLRLDCSKKKIEQVIKMTSDALSKYLNSLDAVEELTTTTTTTTTGANSFNKQQQSTRFQESSTVGAAQQKTQSNHDGTTTVDFMM